MASFLRAFAGQAHDWNIPFANLTVVGVGAEPVRPDTFTSTILAEKVSGLLRAVIDDEEVHGAALQQLVWSLRH
jgi:hypothetical protein